MLWRLYFNTSNVTIQRTGRKNIFIPADISIHLMLLFNCSNIRVCYIRVKISIHLMLLFNGALAVLTGPIGLISIHLMLLFNRMAEVTRKAIQKFQYI